MAFLVEKDEATAGRRFVPFRLFSSNGTSPDTGASGDTVLGSLNGAAQLSLGSVSAVSANAGMYGFQLSQSNVSVLGSWALYTDNIANFPQHVATVQIVNNNPMSTLSAVSNVTLANAEYSAVTVRLGLVAYSGATVGAGNFTPGVYSAVSFSVRDSGIAPSSYQAGSYSGVSVEIKTGGIQTNSIGSATYSGVTIGANPVGDKTGYSISAIAAGTYSSVTIQGLSNAATVVTAGTVTDKTGYTIANGSYSAVTFSTGNIGPGSYSGVTVGINNIAAGAYSGVTVDGAKFLSAAGERSIASSYLSTSLGGTTPRLIQQAYELLRNKVTISGSTMTVYKADDTTSSWTGTISTGTATVYGVAPGLA